MQNYLTFFSMLSGVFTAGLIIATPIEVADEPAFEIVSSINENPLIWHLSVRESSGECTASFVANSNQLSAADISADCANTLPDLPRLSKFETNANGDIIFYHEDGTKFAQFMESESAEHESYWPAHPLMSLVGVR